MNTLPYSQEAEETVIGAMLVNAKAIARASDILQPHDFYLESHGLIYQACVTLWTNKHSVDAVTVSDHLRNQPKADAAVSRLETFARTVTATSNIAHHARIVRETALARDITQAGQAIAHMGAAREKDATDVLEDASQLVYAISRRTTHTGGEPVANAIHSAYDSMVVAYNNGGVQQGATTGYPDIDELVGAFEPGNIVYIGARPSVGKTSLALGMILHHTLTLKQPAILFSIEMSQREIGQRLLSMHSNVPLQTIRRGNASAEQWEKVTASATTLSEQMPLTIDTKSRTPTGIRSELRKTKTRIPGLSLAVVDYIQLMHVAGHKENRNLELSHISRDLKTTAGDYELPVVCLTQLNRNIDERTSKRHSLTDLRDSGSLEQDADFVLLLSRKPDDPGTVTVQVEKNRNGPQGDVELVFHKQTATFRNAHRSAS